MERIYDICYQNKALSATFFLRAMLEILMLGKQVHRKYTFISSALEAASFQSFGEETSQAFPLNSLV